jgi:hypothetical protein
MDTLLLKQNDVTRLTSISGNVELDKLTPFMWIAQNQEVKRVLTDNLYAKILVDFAADNLDGNYKVIYDSFVLPMMVHFTAAHYLTSAPYYQGNGGIYKIAPEGTEAITQKELTSLVSYQRNLGASYELQFHKWLKVNYTSIPEYDPSKLHKTSSKLNWII